MRDALPGRSPRWISALAALERAAAEQRLGPDDGRVRTEKDAAALALHRLSPRGAGRFAYISEGESLDLATRQAGVGTLFLENVEATSTGYQEPLLAHLVSGRPTRFVVALDEDPRDALDGGRLLAPSTRRCREPSSTFRPCASARGTRDPARPLPRGPRPALSFEPDALDALGAHDWPGNTHELRSSSAARRGFRRTIGPTVVRSVLAPAPAAHQAAAAARPRSSRSRSATRSPTSSAA